MALKKCPKCGGSLIKDDGRRKCISCGYKVISPAERHDFIKANAKEIAEDFRLFGYAYTIKRWRISEGALYNLPAVREVRIQKVIAKDGDLPRLPIFSNEWASDVQLKWLEIWEKLKV